MDSIVFRILLLNFRQVSDGTYHVRNRGRNGFALELHSYAGVAMRTTIPLLWDWIRDEYETSSWYYVLLRLEQRSVP